jgi:hypothetical protein
MGCQKRKRSNPSKINKHPSNQRSSGGRLHRPAEAHGRYVIAFGQTHPLADSLEPADLPGLAEISLMDEIEKSAMDRGSGAVARG